MIISGALARLSPSSGVFVPLAVPIHNRLIVPGLCAAALVYACGPWMHFETAGTVTATPGAHMALAATRAPVPGASRTSTVARREAGGVATTFDVTRSGHDVVLALHVVNNTRRTIELRFPSARTHDFTILDARGAMVWRWSDGRLFTQTMQTTAVPSRDTATFRETWNPRGARGTFTAIATLVTAGGPVARRVTFTLP